MRLITPNQYREMLFTPESAPCPRTVRAQIRSGKLPGQKIGSLYYVDLDGLEQKTNLRASLAAREARLVNDPLLAELL